MAIRPVNNVYFKFIRKDVFNARALQGTLSPDNFELEGKNDPDDYSPFSPCLRGGLKRQIFT